MKKSLLYLITMFLINIVFAQKLSILKDIQPGAANSYPASLTLINNNLYFTAEDSLHGEELWISGGAANNTHLLLDLNPGTASSSPANLIYMNGALYFTSNDGTHGYELWKLNLANMHLDMLTNTNVASPFWFAHGFIIYHDQLYFSFDDGIHGSEVWKTNGTITGTKLAYDVRHGATPTSPRDFFIFKNRLFFHGEDDIDTQALYVMNPDDSAKRFFNCGEGGCSAFTVLNNAFYFFSDDRIFSHPDNELYTSDGTAKGTHIVKQINPDGGGTYFGMVASGGELFFPADDGIHGIELWKSNGTAAGTKLVKDITPGSDGSTPDYFIPYHNKVIFQAYKNNEGGAWISDGTAAGTIKLADILVNTDDERNYIVANSKLFFVGYVKNFGYELCVSDGTPAGTKLKLDINKGIGSSAPAYFTPWDSTLFFTADDDVKGYEVFKLSPLNFDDSSTTNIANAIAVLKPKTWLQQNSPNPFNNETEIKYALPDNYKYANLLVYNESGKMIKNISLMNHGTQALKLTAAGLTPGFYYYNLVIDGSLIDSKKCIVI